MTQKIMFNSSLPRSGSTLLQNLLAQNPRIYSSPTSGFMELLYGARKNYTDCIEFKLSGEGFYNKAWLTFCKRGMEGFYEGLTDKPICIDKSRSWVFYYDWLSKFYPNPKIIVCIRDLRSILCSMEKLFRKNSHLAPDGEIASKMQYLTVGKRVDYWMESIPVGIAVKRLFDAIHRGNDKFFHFVIYEQLVDSPIETIKKLYEYMEEPYFQHDFDNIEQVVSENDELHGVYGDHKIKPKLIKIDPHWNEFLGEGVSRMVVENNRWFYKRFYNI